MFLKLNQFWNAKKKLLKLKNQNALFGGPKWNFLKVKFQICIVAFVLQKEAPCQFLQQNINIWVPLNFLKKETLKCVGRAEILELDFYWIIKPDLWLLYLFCQIKKNFHTPP